MVSDIPAADQLADDMHEFFRDILGGQVCEEVQHLLESPLFELGFDSASLLDLQEKIQSRYGISVEPLFFFEHNTGARIVGHLDGLRDEESPPIQSATALPAPAAGPGEERGAAQGDEDSRDIAIIGMACRLPGGIEDATSFWRLLEGGGSAVGTLPEGRWRWPDGIGPSTHPGIDRGGFVTDARRFDAALFRITPREAHLMDPQQRWMLELSWACLEDAGYPPSKVAGAPMGVFVGASGSDYQRVLDTERIIPRAQSGAATAMAVIANRVSYFFDLRGPSVQLDTACSSSLVAVHTAVRALRSGECETALVGGVNVLCHPANSIAYHRAGMLSPDGLCKTFDESANGYVRSEGGAVLLLKPLATALAEGDHVYAVLKGSATNHGGQAGGLTVPSAAMQASLVEAALADARVTPSDISYVEAHGTGTPLGDPIELQGLTRAFAGSVAPCAIGSVKTNLGHLEAAAGITGLVKTVLSIRHGKLPATLHYTRRNPQIALDGTPFSVVDRLSDWDPGNRPIRLAGVSSFGSGGSNAHVIVAEPPAVGHRLRTAEDGEPAPLTGGPRPVVVLSAESEAQLATQAELLLAHLRSEGAAGRPLTDADLMDLAYTTQVGREALTERLCLMPTDVASLASLLEGAASRAVPLPPTVLRGRRRAWKKGERAPAVTTAADAEQLAVAWVRGEEVDWDRLYAGVARPRRVPLPAYAFARKPYWLDLETADADGTRERRRHPLLPRESGSSPVNPGAGHLAFESEFGACDFFLRDHKVRGKHVLPAVAYLEMARAAVDRTLPGTDDPNATLCLENVVWARPIVVGAEDRTVRTVLTREEAAPEREGNSADQRVTYEVSTGQTSAGTHVIHSRGRGSRGRAAAPPPLLDIAALKSRTERADFTVEEYYETLHEAGLDYGDTHRTLRDIRLGDGELLASLVLPDAVADTRQDFVLHPSMLDGALQATLASEARAARGNGPWNTSLPFALDRLEVFGATPASAYAWIREVPGPASPVRRWDLDLCDEQGNIFATLRGYSMRKTTESSRTAAAEEVTLFQPVWREKPTDTSGAPSPGAGRGRTLRLVLACGFEDRLEDLRTRAPHLTFLEPPEDIATAAPGAEAVTTQALELLRVFKGLLLDRSEGSVLLQVLTPSHGESALHQALSGLLRTAQLENPAFVGQVLAVPADSPASYLIERLEEDSRAPEDRQISYGDGRRRVLGWEPLAEAAARPAPWRTGGVYLITGGAGGLGLIFAEEIARRVKDAVICLTGRSFHGPAQETGLASLRALGAKAEYHSLDASDERATEELVAELTRRHGGLHGVIHSAGVIHDSFLVKKPVAEFRRVLTPKLAGCHSLDRATKGTELDFFVLFSSIVGATGSVGQGDYAVANAFLDEFARHRGALVEAGRRSGRTVAIGWPLWQSGGMGTDAATQRALRVRSGLLPMTTEDGIRAFHRALDSGEPRVVVAAGEAERMRALLELDQDWQASAAGVPRGSNGDGREPERVPERDDRGLEARTMAFLQEKFSRVTEMPASDIDVDEPLGSYGMDSILATELTAVLERSFGSLSKTLLFEYHTLAELGAYFIAQHRSSLDAMFAPSEGSAVTPASVAAPAAVGVVLPVVASEAEKAAEDTRVSVPVPVPARGSSTALDIAIIGLSGRYPESRDLREYWQNLREGRDCVVEVPEDRWDWRAYYSGDRTVPGRHYSRWGGFIAEVDRFDPLFFNISPSEAKHLDPQERLFLEHAWTAMEDAGYTRERLRRTDHEAGEGQIGVYASVMWGQYQLLFPDAGSAGGNPSPLGSNYASIANRVSFVMNLHGPSMTVDTMCSGSLTAVDLACRDLRQGRTKLAFAGGVNVTVHPNKYLALSAGQFISSKGHCESFGIGGDGYIPGEGVGVALLKPLHDAERDGDHIYGVIKGSAMSHGGRTNGYTVPNPRAQQAAIHSALREAEVDPRTVSYVEAHGTGTTLGDPIEVTGLTQAFRTAAGGTEEGDSQFCYLGSAKSNIGHCESAAGIAGLTKVLLQMEHGQIAPSLHSATLNPNIDFTRTPFVVNQELRNWERPVLDGRTHPRIAGVSSFGAGGSNAHLVVAEYVDRRPEPAVVAHEPLLFTLSAKSEDRLRAYAGELLRFAREKESETAVTRRRTTPADLAYTLQSGREAMTERLGVVADSFRTLAEKLERYVAGDESVDGLYRGHAKQGKGNATLPPMPAAAPADGPMEHGGLDGLAELWSRGAAPDWRELYARTGPMPRRISAPTYPFARDRHWVPELAPAASAAPTPPAAPAGTPRTEAGPERRTGSGTTLFLTKRWQETVPGAGRTRHFSVIVLHNGATTGLAGELAQRFDDATLLDTSAPDAQAVLERHIGTCTAWIDLTGIADDAGTDSLAEPEASGRVAVSLLQSALEDKASRDIRLLFVTRGLESPDTHGREYAGHQVNPAAGARAALHRMLGSEYRGLTSRHVDLDPAVRSDAEDAAVIHRELTDDAGDVEVCYRAGVRLTPVLAEAAVRAARTARPVFAPDEVLLVTGGTRGLGLLCARHLVDHYGVRRLVLTGREPLPPRHLWATPDACPPSVRDKIAAVLELEAAGVEVRVLALPLDRADEVIAGIATVESTLGRITGVIHAAGLVDTRNPAFVRKPVDDIARVVSPKIDGTRNLLAALDRRALKFVLLFSSVAAAIPALGVGQSDYAMGNAFMDYFAQAYGADLPMTSIQWPSWRETGFGEVRSQAYTDTGLLSITDDEGTMFLDDILTTPRGPVVMPVRVDAGRFEPGSLLDARRPAGAARTGEVVTPAPAAPVTPEPSRNDGETRGRLVAFLSSTLEGQLGLEPGKLDEDTAYADYGADSVLLAQFLQRIQQHLDITLDPATLLEYPTLSELAARLLSADPAVVAARFGAEPQPAEAEGAAVANARDTPSADSSHPARPSERPAATAGGGHGRDKAVAVIGMAARLPGAPDIDSYWELLSQGRSAIREVPDSRWTLPDGAHAGLVDDVFGFDGGYFKLRPEDVRAMDPQALVLLEESLKALHHAGYRPQELEGTRTGVYVGARGSHRTDDALVDGARNPIMTVGQNYLAANVSQFFNWHGPAMVIDTACSSSLVAMRTASDALATGSADLALVAGVSLLTDTFAHELFRRRGLLRENGEFHVFDRRADGVVLGEGAGVVVLKPLDRAERDGDTVYAVIEGMALNNDGRTAGPATPNLAAQKQVMGEALRRAGVRPNEVGHLDVNGSGSEITDLLELKAIEAVYCEHRTSPLGLGSMKPNIGHPLCAEGIAAFIKVVLMLHHQRTVPFLSGEEPMEHHTIDPEHLAFPRAYAPVDLRYASLSSFADGGTNAHVVLGRGRPGLRGPVPLPGLERRDQRTGISLGGVAQPLVLTRHIDAGDAVVDGHRVHGRRLLPGLAWIDLLYGCFEEFAPDVPYTELTLQELTIYRPLSVDAGRAVDIQVEARADGAASWRITVTAVASHGSEPAPLPYITAEMRRTGRAAVDATKIPAEVLEVLRADDGRSRDLEEVYRAFRADGLVHSNLMKTVGAAYVTPEDVWLRVALDERAADDGPHRLFHPALIDGSAVAASGMALREVRADDDSESGDRRLFLPIHYGPFRAGARLGRSCYTRVRRDSVTHRDELFTLAMEFFDSEGRRTGELRNLVTKAVRDTRHIDPVRFGEAPVEPAPPAGGAQAHADVVSAGETAGVVASVVAARIGVPAEQVDTHTSYYELGLDSATLLQMASEIGSRLGAKLSPTSLFEHPTVAGLAAHIVELHGPAVPAVEAPDPSPGRAVHDEPSVPGAQVAERSAAPARETGPGDIAIVGLGGRYPKAGDVTEFWENLKAGRDCVTEVPENRWPRDTFRGKRTPSGRTMASWGGFLDDVDCFDADFFGVPADEAAQLDPQERMFLEVCWEAIEDAGYTPAGLTGTTVRGPRRAVGVFVGVMHKDYVLVQHDAADGVGPAPLSLNSASIAHRVSHFCDFNGPSMAVDTVCASSLSALHLAVESLRRGECHAALAGGVNLSLHPAKYRAYGALELLASDTPARSFGAGADGYVPAEAVGAVLLKPLSSAIADGDDIYAVIKGTAVNHSGRTPGLRTPSVAAQAALIEDCLDRAGIDPASLGYLEAHGTGTEIGDLIEIQALRKVFEERTDAKRFCALGSVKSAIGHAEAAAGISALTKAALQLHHATLTPMVRAERPNPYLDLDDSPFRLQTDLEEWTVDVTGPAAAPRRAGVSAFGATGANAHVLLEEAPRKAGVPGYGNGAPGPVLVPLSATDGERLRAYAEKLLRFLESKDGMAVDASALAHTLQTGRVALAERAVILAYDLDEVKDALGALARGTDSGVGNVWRSREGGQVPESRLLDEDDLRTELVARWAAQGAWDKIAELWTGGYAVDWRPLYAETTPRRLHLPTYPFARRPHWVGAPGESVTPEPGPSAAPGTSVSGQPRLGALHWRYVPESEPLPTEPGTSEPAGSRFSPEERARGFLRQLVAARLGRAADEIGLHTGLIELGLTSLGAVGLTEELTATVDPAFLPSVLFEHTTIAEVAAHLTARRSAALARLVAVTAEEPPRSEHAESVRAEVLAVLGDLHTGELPLEDAIALLDTDRNEK
ncbi:SDR family NAD(P)-dependent oxidoreductase [Streptomyces sp. MCL20-2]|uniref:SDR family NAD(P)-dependent oxidoreductase n=1 Tax=Streptomyces sp. MCL20-2 TaxID=2967219 RepID=UPI0029674472|nr:SDR family NAD(P)-dependent oxidoreductase [Streptomyces sp. MCL20-2]